MSRILLLKNATLIDPNSPLNSKKRDILIENGSILKISTNITPPKNTKVVSSTGYNSRELFQIRQNKENKIKNDFYMVGGMCHSSMVSLGYYL